MVRGNKIVTFDKEWYNIKRDLRQIKVGSKNINKQYIDIASHGIVQVMKENTPTNTGELANSWRVMNKGSDSFVVGTELVDNFLQLVNGVRAQTIFAKNGKAMHFFIGGEEFFRSRIQTRQTPSNPYHEPIIAAMDEMLFTLTMSLMEQNWRIMKDVIKVQKVTKFNLSKIVGLTGTKVNKRRGRGGGLQKAKTGRKSFKRTLSRRRRTGKFITSKKTTVK